MLRNPIIADAFHRTGLIERWGRGTNRVAEMCKAAGIAAPTFQEIAGSVVVTFRVPVAGASQPESQPESDPLVTRVLRVLAEGERGKAAISAGLGQKKVSGPLNAVIRRLTVDRLIEPTLPEKPTSRLQKYRLTAAGRAALRKARR